MDCSFAVFPFLKTSGRISIGQLEFRSTDDLEGLAADEADCVREIAAMLFLKDDLRLKSSSIARCSQIDSDETLNRLVNIQAFVAYSYASPHPMDGRPAFSLEEASMVILTPKKVYVSLVRPTFHVDSTAEPPLVTTDRRGEADGFAGLYNFKHHFWVTKGSRIYGPTPNPVLNQSQDLSNNIEYVITQRHDFRLLYGLLLKANTAMGVRIFDAIQWYNDANSDSSDDASSLVHLAIAFETLLKIPQDEKKKRLVDSISLLLGRVSGLEAWAAQFYNTRSKIVHEGTAQHLRFIPTSEENSAEKNSQPIFYGSLLAFGRKIFRLCLGSVLVGFELAEQASLEEDFIPNQERFKNICRILSDNSVIACDRLEKITAIVSTIRQYQFVPEEGLKKETMLDAVRLAAKTVLECDKTKTSEFIDQFKEMAKMKLENDRLPDALYDFTYSLDEKGYPYGRSPDSVVCALVSIVCIYNPYR